MAGKSKYETNILPHLVDIREWVKTMTEGQIADRCGVVQQTFIKYKAAHPELQEALNAGNAQLVTELRSALKKRRSDSPTKRQRPTSVRKTASGSDTWKNTKDIRRRTQARATCC